MSDLINKDEYMSKMADNLILLRTKLRLKQTDLANKVGISRQTLMGIENKKRAMTWNTFVALLTIFREDNSTNDLLEHFEIYTPELGKFLTSPENGNR
jgi:DNA-binding XRE family transcriptional regulator